MYGFYWPTLYSFNILILLVKLQLIVIVLEAIKLMVIPVTCIDLAFYSLTEAFIPVHRACFFS